MNGLRCYHHCNSDEHPAVARCSECGKGLCRECSDKLSSPKTGKLLCADCRNAELERDRQLFLRNKEQQKKEAIIMWIGFIIGTAAEITFGCLSTKGDIYTILFAFSFMLFLPTLLASLGTIVSTVADVFDNLLLRIVFFVILAILSPIMFIVRLTRRTKKGKQMKRLAAAIEREQQANNDYKEAAMLVNKKLESKEAIESKVRAEYEQKITAIQLDNEIDKVELDRRVNEIKQQAEKDAAQRYENQIKEAQEAQARADKSAMEALKAQEDRISAVAELTKTKAKNRHKNKANARGDREAA
ncbi:MAG: hypothetical protein K2M48_02660 [Clostridiales bacterium]|nr:hypothetical protein [Clostridiales bacterium]